MTDFPPLLTSALPNLTADDHSFLAAIFERFPSVQEGFELFSNLPENFCIRVAGSKLERQPRQGWLRFDLLTGSRNILNTHGYAANPDRWLIWEELEPVTETVLEHSAEAQDLYQLLYLTDPQKQWGMEVMKFHDFAEAVMGDFTPSDPITRDEKQRLESIALDLLTRARHTGDLLAQHIYNCLQIYEGNFDHCNTMRDQMLGTIQQQRVNGEIKPAQQGVVAFLENLYGRTPADFRRVCDQVTDTDTLHMALRGYRMIKQGHCRLPADEAFLKMEEFWTYIGKQGKLKTPLAQNFFEHFRSIYLREDCAYRPALSRAMAYAHNCEANPSFSSNEDLIFARSRGFA